MAVTRAQPPRRTRCSQALAWQMARCRVSLGTRDGQDPVISGFLLRLPRSPRCTLGGGPRIDGGRAGGIAVKLSGEPCTNNALHKGQ